MVEGTQAPGLICDPHELQLRRFNFSLRGNEETTPSQTKEFRRHAERFFAADWGAHMTMQQNTDRIQTTHIGSLPRPHRLLDALKAKYSGQPYDEAEFQQALRAAVADVVRKQVDCGLDIITDGEFSKPGFFTYIRERLAGFESRPNAKFNLFEQEVAAFPEYYEQYFKQAMMGGTVVSLAPVVCVGPVKYRGEKLVKIDIDNMIAAAAAAGVAKEHVFLPATAPSGVGKNEYYKSDEEYFHALAAEMSKEYRAILEAGILVQIDDPFLPDIFLSPASMMRKRNAEPKFMSRRSTRRLGVFRLNMCAFTPATASTKVRVSTKRRSKTSSSMCCKSMLARTASKPPIPATSTNTICSSR
jgi:5-methyltetrahydropteroyltriglutamate--homocysteine methyltransferase